MKSVCVYCGSSPGNRPEYAEAARALGKALVENDMSLVYGGGKVGLMGIIADACWNTAAAPSASSRTH